MKDDLCGRCRSHVLDVELVDVKSDHLHVQTRIDHDELVCGLARDLCLYHYVRDHDHDHGLARGLYHARDRVGVLVHGLDPFHGPVGDLDRNHDLGLGLVHDDGWAELCLDLDLGHDLLRGDQVALCLTDDC